MKAQKLYDTRQEFEFCSGTELHEFFWRVIGDSSPKGNVEVDDTLIHFFVRHQAAQMLAHSEQVARRTLANIRAANVYGDLNWLVSAFEEGLECFCAAPMKNTPHG